MSFKGEVYDFSVDYDAIDKSDILDIHKHLIVLTKTVQKKTFHQTLMKKGDL